MSNEAIHVRHNEAKNRYEVEIDGQLAVLEYMDAGGVRYYTHTGVPHALEGHGVAAHLAQFALDEAQAAGLTIVPQCPFVRSYIERHPQYNSMVKY